MSKINRDATPAKPRHPGGRPPKFREARRPVTVTLPERTLDQLHSISTDRAKAIVKAVDSLSATAAQTPLRAEVVEMAPGTGVIVVPPNQSLRSIPFLKMIEIAPLRHLLTLDSGTPIEKVEISLIDLLENARHHMPHEVPMLETLREKIGQLRRGDKISTAEIMCVAI